MMKNSESYSDLKIIMPLNEDIENLSHKIPDTAEYWNDIKSHFKNKRIFIDKDFEKKEVSYAKKQAKKYGFKFDSIINFGKYKGNTLEWIKNNDGR